MATSSVRNFQETITCPVCYGYYRNPKKFSSCSHSLCLDCMQQIYNAKKNQVLQELTRQYGYQYQNYDGSRIVTNLQCPVCRQESPVSANGPSDFPTDIALKQIVELAQAQAGVTQRGANSGGEDTCAHFLTGEKKQCRHCNNSFCEACLFKHMERLKMEVKVIRKKLTAERFREATSGLQTAQTTIDTKKAELDKQMDAISSQVDSTIDALTAKLAEALHAKEEHLLAEGIRLRDEELKQVRETFEAGTKAAANDNGLAKRISQLAGTSVLSVVLQDIADLYGLASERERKLETVELFKEKTYPRKITFTTDQQLETNLSNILETQSLGNVELKPKTRTV